uniref:Uncharacterized protein n=1 Tax=Anguilla anguilla TaxID=7936 RepID=A0A0E9UUC1_ANGAN
MPTVGQALRPVSVPKLTNALVAEWKRIPTAMFQNLLKSFPRRVEGDQNPY